MKSLFMSLIYSGLLLGLAACSDHQFSELETKPIEDSGGRDPDAEMKGPDIVWVQVPNSSLAVGDDVTVVYEVVEGSSPVVEIECIVNDKSIACEKEGDKLTIKGQPEGVHHLQITVTDANKLQDSDGIDWQVHEKFLKVKMPLVIADEDDQVDVLVVVDNSGSMANEQKNMAERITSFIDRLQGLDWRLGIVTTDFASTTIGKGQLLQFPNKSYYLTSKLDINEARKQFAATIQRKEKGDANEQGIRAAYRAIERAFSGNAGIDEQHKEFFRKNAALAVIVLSDENESGSGVANKPANMVEHVKDSFGPQKLFKFHSIIVRPGDDVCLKASAEHHTGQAYADLSKLTDGILGDICAKDYGNQLKVIGQDIAGTQNTFALACVPKDINSDGIPDVTVKSLSGVDAPNFVIKDDTIEFSKAPKIGKYSIEYFCPKK